MTPDIDALLRERGATHGDYAAHAEVTQRLKIMMRMQPGWLMLTAMQAEALEMIAHKIARVIVGNPNHADHWDDIAGYARLVSQRLAPPDAPQSLTPAPEAPAAPEAPEAPDDMPPWPAFLARGLQAAPPPPPATATQGDAKGDDACSASS